MSYAITDFLEPINGAQLSNDEGYREGQIGKRIRMYEEEFPEIGDVDLVIVGCGEERGAALLQPGGGPDAIRSEFYKLYHWHNDIQLADIGNVKIGKSISDTHAALKMVLQDLLHEGKRVIILGGSHDLTLAQYDAFAEEKQLIDAVGVDAVIDINIDSPFRTDKFLMAMLTAEPNYMRHYSHIGFQSYFVHPRMLETMDKLRFDCFRTGMVKERLEDMEPVIRNCALMTFDIAAIAHAFAPANDVTPNGFNGEEACTLMQYAGMSPNMRTIGIYGYRPQKDTEALTAKQISHMLWYLMDGRSRGKKEAALEERESFNEFHIQFAELETVFLQSKKTGRWWMQLPDGAFTACAHSDYLTASRNDIPERWFRVLERP